MITETHLDVSIPKTLQACRVNKILTFFKSRKIIAFSHLNSINFNDNFKDNFMQEKVNKMVTKAKTLNIKRKK